MSDSSPNPYSPPQADIRPGKGRTSALAVAGLILAIIPGCVTNIIGIILGAVALRQISRSSHLRGRGLALAAILVGGVQVSLVLVFYLMYNIVASTPPNEQTARTEIGALSQAVKLYRMESGRYPTTEEGLQLLLEPNGEGAPVLDRLPFDPWGEPYRYRRATLDAESFCVSSVGADGRHGTSDDITCDDLE